MKDLMIKTILNFFSNKNALLLASFKFIHVLIWTSVILTPYNNSNNLLQFINYKRAGAASSQRWYNRVVASGVITQSSRNAAKLLPRILFRKATHHVG